MRDRPILLVLWSFLIAPLFFGGLALATLAVFLNTFSWRRAMMFWRSSR